MGRINMLTVGGNQGQSICLSISFLYPSCLIREVILSVRENLPKPRNRVGFLTISLMRHVLYAPPSGKSWESQMGRCLGVDREVRCMSELLRAGLLGQVQVHEALAGATEEDAVGFS